MHELNNTFRMKVLVIDDNVSIGKMLKQFLELKGHQCVTVADGYNGLELIRKQKFDVIVLDLAMPEFSGFDVVNELSGTGEIKNQNIIVLTAVAVSKDQINQLLKAGVKSFLKKPVSPEALLTTITSSTK